MREDWIEILYKDAVHKISTTKQKLKQKEYSQFGEFPIVDQGQDEIGGYSDDKDRILDCKLPVVVFGDHTKCVKLINFKFIPGADGTKVLEPKKGIEPKYISTLTHVLVHKIKDKGYARHYQHIEKENLPLAPLPEQRAIVAKIEELFSSLDQGIADLKKAQDQLKVYRQAVLKKAFEGNWDEVPLEDISEAIGGNAFKSKTFLKEKGKYQIIRIGNIRPGIIRYGASPVYINDVDDKTLNKYLLKKGDLIITLTGTRNKRDYGFTALVETENLLLNQRLAYLRFKKGCLPKFYLYFTWSEPFKVQFFGSETGNVGQGNVGMKSVRQTLVPKLPVEKQHQIVQEIESRLSVCDKVENDIALAIERSRNLRQSILKKAFEGTLLSEEEIAVCKAAPDYEPASVLLARIEQSRNEKIKAETLRQAQGKKKKKP
jgi:type I restriction enzyme S subunit